MGLEVRIAGEIRISRCERVWNMAVEQARTRPAYYIQSLERGLLVLRAFDRDHPSMTVSQAAKRTGLTRGTAQRFLRTLNDLGYVDFDGKNFQLRPRVLNLGFAYLESHDVWETVEPFVKEVVRQLNESCTVGVLDSPDVIYVCRVQARRMVNAVLTVGSRIPANASSLGQTLLAYLDPEELDQYFATQTLTAPTPNTVTDPDKLRKILHQIRLNGWALGDQEYEVGVRSISVPLIDRQGKVIAAMMVVAPASRATKPQLIKSFLPVLQEQAERASEALSMR